MISAADALARLRDGNQRFVADQTIVPALSSHARRAALVAGQEPFAILLGCSDSRVPAELVFDQGFGDLFVIRVAGNVVAPSQVGSVEFAAARFGTRLAVVMGHSQCGAVIATVEEVLGRTTNHSRNLRSIVDRVRPSVETLLADRREEDPRCAGARCGPGQRSCLRESPAARVSAAGAIDPGGWAPGGRCRVLVGNGSRNVLRWRFRSRVTSWCAA
jgi:carbonic anhydrase